MKVLDIHCIPTTYLRKGRCTKPNDQERVNSFIFFFFLTIWNGVLLPGQRRVSRWAGYPLGAAQAGNPSKTFKAQASWIRGFNMAKRATAKFWEEPESDWQVQRLCRRVASNRECVAVLWQLQWWRKVHGMVAVPRAESQAGSSSWGGRGQGGMGGGSVNWHFLYNQGISSGSRWWTINLTGKEHHYFSVPVKKMTALQTCYLLFTRTAISYIL